MTPSPRYRFGEPSVDEAIQTLIAEIGGSDDADLVHELVVSSLQLAVDGADRGEIKIANAALREMRRAFRAFAPFRDRRKVSIFGSARTHVDDPLYRQTVDVAAAFAEEGWMVITGAGPGIMEAGIEGAGPENSFGVGIKLPFEAATTQFLDGDPKLLNFRYFFTRKLAFMKESSAFVLLPGGFGTMDEAFELLTLVQTGKSNPAPIVLLEVPGGTYWQAWTEFLHAEVETRGYVSSRDFNLFTIATDAQQGVNEALAFFDNYHSIRFVEGKLVMRMHDAPDEARCRELTEDFADIVESGTIERTAASPEEITDDDHVDLERITFRFDRRGWARLRELIDVLNARV